MNPLSSAQPLGPVEPSRSLFNVKNKEALSLAKTLQVDVVEAEKILAACKAIKKYDIKEIDVAQIRKDLAMLVPLEQTKQIKTAVKTLKAFLSKFHKNDEEAFRKAVDSIKDLGSSSLFRKDPTPEKIADKLLETLPILNRAVMNGMEGNKRAIQNAKAQIEKLKEKYGDNEIIKSLLDATSEALTYIESGSKDSIGRELSSFSELDSEPWIDELLENIPPNMRQAGEEVITDKHLSPLLENIQLEVDKEPIDWEKVQLTMDSISQYAPSLEPDIKKALNEMLKVLLEEKIPQYEPPDAASKVDRLLHMDEFEALSDTLYLNGKFGADHIEHTYSEQVKKTETIDGVKHSSASVKDSPRLGSLQINGNPFPLATAGHGEYFNRLSTALSQQGLSANQIVNIEAFMNQQIIGDSVEILAANLLENQTVGFLVPTQINGSQNWSLRIDKQTNQAILEGRISYTVRQQSIDQGVIATKTIVKLPLAALDHPLGEVKQIPGATQEVVFSKFLSYRSEDVAAVNKRASDSI